MIAVFDSHDMLSFVVASGMPTLRFERCFESVSLVVVGTMGCCGFVGVASAGKVKVALESVAVRSGRALDDFRGVRFVGVVSEGKSGMLRECVVSLSGRILGDI